MLNRLIHVIDNVIEYSGRLVAWLTLAMVCVTFAVVLLRYGFDVGWIAMQEAINVMHAMVFLIGAAYTLKHNEHVRVDIFQQKLSARNRAWIELIGHVVFLLPVMLFIIWVSWDYIGDSWAIQEASRETGGLPGVYLVKSLIVVMAALLILQSISGIARALKAIGGTAD